MERITFLNFKDRKMFFNIIKKLPQFSSWQLLAKYLETSRSMLENYRKGKLLLPEDKFVKLWLLLDKSRQEYFSKKISKKPANWGQVIGGLKAYKINKIFFDKGRKLSIDKVKYNFDINMPLSQELCEFLGVIIGDGCTNKYGHTYHTQIAGDKNLDKDYYFNYLSPVCIKLFSMAPKIVIRPKGIYMNIYSKRVFELLTKRFKIPAGTKCYTVKIPQEILDAKKDMLKFVLRGMFNTDGGVGLDKRKSYKKPYIRINYTSASPDLIKQIDAALDEYNIFHSTHDKNNGRAKQIQINGEINVKKFMDFIGFSNPRHSSKLNILTD